MRYGPYAGFVLLALFFTGGCAQYNSSSQDESVYNESVIESGGDPNFSTAFTIIQNQCASCHSHASWNNLNSNALWIASGYVIKGQAGNSVLIQKTFQNGTGNMPPSNTLNSSDFNALKNWINNIP